MLGRGQTATLLALTSHPHCLQTQTGRLCTSLCCPPRHQCSSSPATHSLTELTVICTTAESVGEAACPDLLEQVTKGANNRIKTGGHERWKSQTSELLCISLNERWFPILLTVPASWTNALQDYDPVKQSLKNCNTKASVILEQAERTRDYCTYPNISWDFFFIIHHLKHGGGGVSHLMTTFCTGIVLQTIFYVRSSYIQVTMVMYIK